ncbi:MAG: hypothetical protein C4K60_19760 [Ideonella sp. MAG2]|nr:MAG: hypothetical protein C4K60_19760 [Ideonella sp. MAG2]
MANTKYISMNTTEATKRGLVFWIFCSIAALFLLVVISYGILKFFVVVPNGEFSFENKKYTYSLHLPKNFSVEKSYSLVVILHGQTSTGEQTEFYTGFNNTADRHNLIAVYPNLSHIEWPWSTEEGTRKKSTYINALISHLSSTYKINQRQMYFIGFSAGSVSGFRYLQDNPGKFAAAALIAGGAPKALYPASGPFATLPILLMSGTADQATHGNADILGVSESAESYVKSNGCDAQPANKEVLPDLDPDDHSTINKYTYRCPKNLAVQYYEVVNGGHHWPGARFNAALLNKNAQGNFNRDIDTGELIWDFFSKTGMN